MKKRIAILFPIILLSLFFSCNKVKVAAFMQEKKDSIMVFEIDSILMEDELEVGYSSILDMPPFNTCSQIGSMAYGKDYNIDVLMLPSSDSAYIVLSEMFNKDKDGNPLWRLADSIKIYYPVGASIGWPGMVVRGDVIDYELMALLPEDNDWIDTEVYDTLLGVWSLDKEEKIINSVSGENVSCINESYGVY